MIFSFRTRISTFNRRSATAIAGTALLMNVGPPPALAASGSDVVVMLPAHARLEAVVPKDGASAESPTEVQLTFNEKINVDFVKVTVVGPGGSVAAGEPEVKGRVVRQPLTAAQDPGGYEVKYRVVSTDGHPISGTSSFTSLVSASTAPSPRPPQTPTVTPVSPVPSDAVRHSAVGVTRDRGVPDIVLLTLAAVAVVALVLGGVAVARRRINE